jgi:capsid portal protein
MEKHHTIKEKAESYVKTNRSKLVTNLKEICTILNGAADIVAEAYNECDDEDMTEANDILRYIKCHLHCNIIDKPIVTEFFMSLDAPTLTSSKRVKSYNRQLEVIRRNKFKQLNAIQQDKEKGYRRY